MVKKAVLYSLFIMTSLNNVVYAQDESACDNQDFILVCESCSDEIYPLEDIDTICLISEIENYIENLQIDSSEIVNIMIQDHGNIKKEAIIVPQENNIDAIEIVFLPKAPEDIVILDHKNIHNNQNVIDDFLTITNCNDSSAAIEKEQNLIDSINVDELEKLLHILENVEFNVSNENFLSQESFYTTDAHYDTISIDNLEISIAADNGINLQQNHEAIVNQRDGAIEIDEDDDIIPVPHDLINSVKKATKKNKKLEKNKKRKIKSKNKKIK